MKKITKKELIEKLQEILTSGGDQEIDHATADELLLQYIGDKKVSQIFNDIDKWYA
jgi:hypothetical protein